MPKTISKARVPAVLSPAAQEVQKAITEMNPALKEVHKEINITARTANATEIMTRYAYGKWIATVMQDKRKFGENAVKLLAVALGISESLLYSFRSLYLQWKDDYKSLQAIVERKNIAGSTMTFSHFVVINKIPDAEDRIEMVETCLRDCLSVDDLARVVADKYSTSRGDKGATVNPRNPSSGIAVMTKALDKVGDGHKKIQTSVFDQIETNPDDHADTKFVQKLEGLVEQINEARKLLDEDARRLQATLDTLSRIMSTESDDEDDGGEEPAPTRAPAKPAAKAPVKSTRPQLPAPKSPSPLRPNSAAPKDVVSRIKQAQAARAQQGTGKRLIAI
jgi:hypothetical protein